MKKKKIIIVLILTFLTYMSFVNVNAASCGSYTKQNNCNKHSDKCKWYSNKCYSLADAQSKCLKDCESRSSNESVINTCKKDSCGITTSKTLTSTSSDAKIKASSKVNFCASTAKVWKVIGLIFTIFKILIPIILIILGSIDLARAIFDNQDGILKAIKRLIFRFISAIVIFLLPSFITVIIGLFLGFNDDKSIKQDYEYCKKCIVSPSKCDTSKDASKSNTLDS